MDPDQEAWPNADLAVHSSYEGALIDGLPADKVKAGDEQEIKQMKDLQLYSWVKETDIPPDKSILLTGWARRMKGSEVRSRCLLKDFATTLFDGVFAPTPSPLSVRGLLLCASWFDLRVETGDLVCAFMQADSSCEMFARPPKGQERDGWIWRLHGAMNGMRTASRDLTEFLAGILTEHMGFKRGKLERRLFVHETNETRVVSHGGYEPEGLFRGEAVPVVCVSQSRKLRFFRSCSSSARSSTSQSRCRGRFPWSRLFHRSLRFTSCAWTWWLMSLFGRSCEFHRCRL